MTSPDLIRRSVAPDPPGPLGDGYDGFVDCRGEWHCWAQEEDE